MVAVRKVLRKPGSVLFAVQTGTTLPRISDNHLSRPIIANWLKRPTQTRLGLRLLPRKLRSIRSCSRWGLPGTMSPAFLGVSYTSVPSLPDPLAAAIGGPFLWHYPSTCADWTLSSTLPYGARTFLSRRLTRRQRLSVKLSGQLYYSIQGKQKGFNPLYLPVFTVFTCYINRNGSVFISDAITFVSYRCFSSLALIHSATFVFMIFSALCPGSTSAIPALNASCAVW